MERMEVGLVKVDKATTVTAIHNPFGIEGIAELKEPVYLEPGCYFIDYSDPGDWKFHKVE